MSRNIDQVYTDNPSTTADDDDLFYKGNTPYGPTDDSAIKFSDLQTSLFSENRPSAYSSFGLGSTEEPLFLVDADFTGGIYQLTNPCPKVVGLLCDTPGNIIRLPSAQGVDSFIPTEGIVFKIPAGKEKVEVQTLSGVNLLLLNNPSFTTFTLDDNSTSDGSWSIDFRVQLINAQSGDVTIPIVVESWDGSTTPVDVTAGPGIDITDGVISLDGSGASAAYSGCWVNDNNFTFSFTDTSTFKGIRTDNFPALSNNFIAALDGSDQLYFQYTGNESAEFRIGISNNIRTVNNTNPNSYQYSIGIDSGSGIVPIVSGNALMPFVTQGNIDLDSVLVPYNVEVSLNPNDKVYPIIKNKGDANPTNNEIVVRYLLADIQKIGDTGGTSSGVASLNGLTGNLSLISGDSTVSISPSGTDIDLTVDLASKLSLSGGTMTGSLILNSDPTVSLEAATKQYVDNAISNLNFYVVTSATFVNNPVVYNNGSSGVGATLTSSNPGQYVVDGINVVVGQEYLFGGQTNQFENGIYTCTITGGIGIQAVFTRATNYDTPSEITPGDTVFVSSGTLNAGSSWIQTQTITTIGTDSIVFIAQGGSAISLTGDVTGSGYSPVATTISNLAVTNAKIANSTIDLTTKVTGILPIANGGTSSASQNINGICYIDAAPAILSSTTFTHNGTSAVTLTSSSTTAQFSIINNFTGSTNNAILLLQRGDQANGIAQVRFNTSSTQQWRVGLKTGDESFHFNDDVSGLDRMVLAKDGRMTINGSSGSVTDPTGTSLLNLNSSTQVSSRITLSGQEFYQAANTSTNGIAILLGVNRSGNRQLWIGTSDSLTQNSTNRTIRISPSGGQIDAVATDGTTALTLQVGQSGSVTTISGSTINITPGAVNIANLTASLPVFTDSSKNLVSQSSIPQNVGGTNTTSGYTASALIFQNSGNTAFSSSAVYTISGSATLNINNSTSGAQPTVSLVQGDNSNPASNSRVLLQTGGASGGDPYIGYVINGVTNWTHGIDNSDGDAFVFSLSSSLGTSNILRLSATTNNVSALLGDISASAIGKGYNIAGGTNARAGTGAVLVGGTVTVNTTAVATGDTIFLSCTALGGTPGIVRTSAIVNATSFTLTSSNGLDTSTYSWEIRRIF